MYNKIKKERKIKKMERKEKGYLASEVEEKLGITATERRNKRSIIDKREGT